MKHNSKWLPGMLLTLIVNVAQAALNPGHFPLDLIYLNKPIDPLCFFNLPNQEQKIDFRRCGLNQSHYQITRIEENLVNKHFYGFEWGDPAVKYPTGGYSYYQAWDAGSRYYWIYTMNSTGGSGDFTSVNLFSRTDANTGNLKQIQGGDRCNGGISHVGEKAYDLTYAVNLTAYDMLMLAKNHPTTLKAYDDLAACAVCCVAKANYQTDVHLRSRLLHVDLVNERSPDEMPAQGKYQACFNQLVEKYLRQHNANLDPNELETFANEFSQTCMKA